MVENPTGTKIQLLIQAEHANMVFFTSQLKKKKKKLKRKEQKNKVDKIWSRVSSKEKESLVGQG